MAKSAGNALVILKLFQMRQAASKIDMEKKLFHHLLMLMPFQPIFVDHKIKKSNIKYHGNGQYASEVMIALCRELTQKFAFFSAS